MSLGAAGERATPITGIRGYVPLSRRRLLGLAAAFPAGWALSGLRPAGADQPDRAAGEAGGLTGQLLFVTQADRGDDPALSGLFVLDLKENAWHKVAAVSRFGIHARLSPDGRQVVFSSSLDEDKRVFVVGSGGGESRPVFEGDPDRGKVAFWSPDGRQLLVAPAMTLRGTPGETWRVDVDGSGKERVPIPAPENLVDWSPDGRWILTQARGEPKENDRNGILGTLTFVRRADGTDAHRVGEPGDRGPRFAPDSRGIFFARNEGEPPRGKINLWRMDLDGTHSRRYFERPDDAVVMPACVSPDGTRAMVNWFDEVDGKGGFRVGSGHIEVLDVEGGRHQRLDLPHPRPFALDWR